MLESVLYSPGFRKGCGYGHVFRRTGKSAHFICGIRRDFVLLPRDEMDTEKHGGDGVENIGFFGCGRLDVFSGVGIYPDLSV